MVRKFYIISLLLLLVINLKAQVDPVAESIVNRFSELALKADAISMSFDIKIVDSVEGTETEESGEIVIKGDFYKLTIPGNIAWFDGTAIYTLVPEVEEVTITEPDPDAEAFLSKPSLLFTMFEQGYKIRLVEEKSDASVIDLYPEDLGAEFSRVRLLITKDYSLQGVEYKRKDGIVLTLSITNYNLKKSYKDTFFKFDSKQYKNVDIIDMRF